MGLTEFEGSLTHGLERRAVVQQAGQFLGCRVSISNTPCRATGECVLTGLGKIVGVWAEQYRAAAGGGFDQVLSAKGQQGPADQGHIGGGEIGGHLAHAVTQPNLRFRVGQGFTAAANAPLPRLDEGRHFAETLWVAWHQQQQDFRAVQSGEGVKNQHLLAFAGAGGQPDRACSQRLSPASAQRQFLGRRGDIELEVAGNPGVSCTNLRQPCRIGRGLCDNRRQCGDGWTDQRQKTPLAAQRALGQAGIHQHHGNAPMAGGGNQVWP